MAIYWINPGNTGAADGLTRATGWPDFTYLIAANITTDYDHEIRIAGLAPTTLSGTFTFTLNSVTVTYTGASADLSTILNLGGFTDMIALPSYITSLLDVPYVVSSISDNGSGTGTITLTTPYQGASVVVSTGIIKINCYRNITSMSNDTGDIYEASIIGGWLESDTTSPSGISWFERTDAVNIGLITDSHARFRGCSIERLGLFKYGYMFSLATGAGSYNTRYLNECYWIASSGADSVTISLGTVCGNIYNCHDVAANRGISIQDYCKVSNFISFCNTGIGFNRGQNYTSVKDSEIDNLYVYGNGGSGLYPASSCHVKNLHALRNTEYAIRQGYTTEIHVENVIEYDGTLYGVNTVDFSPLIDEWGIHISNVNGSRFWVYTTGVITYNTTDAYNTECLRFAPSCTGRKYVTWKNMYVRCTANTALTLSLLMKRSSDFVGVVQYSVWQQHSKIVDWTNLTLTTSYANKSFTIPAESVATTGAVEVRVRVNGVVGYVYLAERNGYYVRIN